MKTAILTGNPRAPRLAANPTLPLCQSAGLPPVCSGWRDEGVGRDGTHWRQRNSVVLVALRLPPLLIWRVLMLSCWMALIF